MCTGTQKCMIALVCVTCACMCGCVYVRVICSIFTQMRECTFLCDVVFACHRAPMGCGGQGTHLLKEKRRKKAERRKERVQEKDKELAAKVGSWQKFMAKKGGMKVKKHESIFKSPDTVDGKVSAASFLCLSFIVYNERALSSPSSCLTYRATICCRLPLMRVCVCVCCFLIHIGRGCRFWQGYDENARVPPNEGWPTVNFWCSFWCACASGRWKRRASRNVVVEHPSNPLQTTIGGHD